MKSDALVCHLVRRGAEHNIDGLRRRRALCGAVTRPSGGPDGLEPYGCTRLEDTTCPACLGARDGFELARKCGPFGKLHGVIVAQSCGMHFEALVTLGRLAVDDVDSYGVAFLDAAFADAKAGAA